MINPETGQPFTRRELREREKGGVAATPEPMPAAEEAARTPVAETAEASPVAHPVAPEETPPERDHSSREPAPAPAGEPPTLTRREIRERNRGRASEAETPTPVSEPPAPVTAPTQDLASVAKDAAPPPPVSEEPLPPVFAPVVGSARTADSESSPALARGPGDVLRTTSSLIMPSPPDSTLTGPLGATGEIVVTGQIRLPSELSNRGTAPFRLDTDDNEEVMDAYVTGEIGALSQPVSALHAVSGRSKDSEMLSLRKTRWGTGTIVTMLVLGTLGIAAVGLVILSLTTGVLL